MVLWWLEVTLGVEMNPEDVPVVQKTIINLCRSKGVPVVVATQMLESMIESPTLTRAECSDVATALYDGADAVMLSAESAAGAYPEEAVTMQRRVISRVEADPYYRKAHGAQLDFALLEERSTTTTPWTPRRETNCRSYLRQSADRLHVGRYDRINSGFFTAERAHFSSDAERGDGSRVIAVLGRLRAVAGAADV